MKRIETLPLEAHGLNVVRAGVGSVENRGPAGCDHSCDCGDEPIRRGNVLDHIDRRNQRKLLCAGEGRVLLDGAREHIQAEARAAAAN